MKPSPAELRALRRRDPALARVLDRVPPFPGFPGPEHRRARSHFEYLAAVICHQQLAGAAARAIWERVRALGPAGRFPRPAEWLDLPEEELARAGLSAPKRRAIADLAARCVEGELDLSRVARLSDEALVRRLTRVRGIGAWTAQMFLLFRLGRLDVVAPGDLGVQEGVRLLEGLPARPTPREVEERAERWRPLRSVGTWAMWRLVELERAAGAPADGGGGPWG